MYPTFVTRINENLTRFFGEQGGHPNFRVSWTTHEREFKQGTFEIFYKETDIYLRTETGIKEVPKYPFKPDRWVLEKFTDARNVDELASNISYEPFWIFEKNGEYQEPIWKAVKYLVYQFLFQTKEKKTGKDAAIVDRKQFEDERQLYLDILEDDSPHVASQLGYGSAIVVPRSYNG